MTMHTPSRTRATGTITVNTYDDSTYGQREGAPTLHRLSVTETFAGDIQGEGEVEFLQVVRADGSASFVGIERVVGHIAGRSGSFILQDQGTLIGQQVQGEWFVVPGSATEELAGLRGEGEFSAQLGQHAQFSLDYWFE